MGVLANFEECGVRKSITDLEGYCEKNDCGVTAFISNIMFRGMTITEAIN